MKVFKNSNCTYPVSESSFTRTLKCMSNANWNRTRSWNKRIEYHGYSNGNMAKAINSRHPMIYSHYALYFYLENNTALIENNNSSYWFIRFDTIVECKNFKRNVLKKFFNTANQKMNKRR